MGTRATLVGYARVSTLDQKPQLQLDALRAAGCQKVFIEKAPGAKEDRAQLQAALDYMRPGDTLVVWKLDCEQHRHAVVNGAQLPQDGREALGLNPQGTKERPS